MYVCSVLFCIKLQKFQQKRTPSNTPTGGPSAKSAKTKTGKAKPSSRPESPAPRQVQTEPANQRLADHRARQDEVAASASFISQSPVSLLLLFEINA